MNIIVITGASSGMGREFAKELDRLRRIDEIWLIARRAQRMEELAKEMNHSVRILPLDLTRQGDVELFSQVLEQEKPVIRMLINCAGYGLMGGFSKIDLNGQSGEVDLNCRALMQMTHICLPYMRKKSRILQLASSAAFLPQPDFAVYAATKSFVLSFSRALREEVKDRQIYVTAVCPGPVKTEFFEVAERYGTTLAVKKLTMVEPKRVVKEALEASAKNRPLSVCGFWIKGFWAVSKLLPTGLLLRLTGLMKAGEGKLEKVGTERANEDEA